MSVSCLFIWLKHIYGSCQQWIMSFLTYNNMVVQLPCGLVIPHQADYLYGRVYDTWNFKMFRFPSGTLKLTKMQTVVGYHYLYIKYYVHLETRNLFVLSIFYLLYNFYVFIQKRTLLILCSQHLLRNDAQHLWSLVRYFVPTSWQGWFALVLMPQVETWIC